MLIPEEKEIIISDKNDKVQYEISQALSGITRRSLRICRYIGLKSIRTVRKSKRNFAKLAVLMKKSFKSSLAVLTTNFKVFLTKSGFDLYGYFDKVNESKLTFNEYRSKGNKILAIYLLKSLCGFVGKGAKKFLTSPSYLAPIVAAACFGVVVYTTLGMTYALEVKYDGKVIGYIEDESVFENAELEVLKRIVAEDYIQPDDTMPEFSLIPMNEESLSSEDELTDKIIRASGNEILDATGLYVDNRFIGAVDDTNELVNLLEGIKNTFSTGAQNEKIEFVKDVEMLKGLYPVTSLVNIENIEDQLKAKESEESTYIAVAGDSPILISNKLDVDYAELKALNPDIEKKLFIGQEILIKKAVPMLQVMVIRTEKDEKEVGFDIEHIQDGNQYEGYVKTVQTGERGVEEIVSDVTYVDGIVMARNVLSTKTLLEPINEKLIVGKKSALYQDSVTTSTTMKSSDGFLWPLPGGTVTCAFGSAGYWGHTGLDIGNMATGSPVRASASGTVIMVKYNHYGYGYHVMIDHGGGVQTLYAHNSKIYVEQGQWVEQGDTIAGVGRTGNASGVHVHFEIRANGNFINPMAYF